MNLSDLEITGKFFVSFGIVDSEPIAHCDVDNADLWVAEVINRGQEEVCFFPLDGKITLFNADGTQAKCCDCMLADPGLSRLYFVELKDRKLKPLIWLKDACEQLKSTLMCFREDLIDRKVCAQVCNKRQIRSVRSAERMNTFKQETGYRLYVGRQVKW